MNDFQSEAQIERKARRRAMISGALTSMFIVFSLALVNYFSYKPKVPLANVFGGAVCFSLFFAPMGGLAGNIGDRVRDGILATEICVIVVCSLGLIVALMTEQTWNLGVSWFLLLCCIFASGGAICGCVGAVWGRSCRRSDGKRFWPQFSLAELMIVVLLVAMLMSCLVTLRQVLGKAS